MVLVAAIALAMGTALMFAWRDYVELDLRWFNYWLLGRNLKKCH